MSSTRFLFGRRFNTAWLLLTARGGTAALRGSFRAAALSFASGETQAVFGRLLPWPPLHIKDPVAAVRGRRRGGSSAVPWLVVGSSSPVLSLMTEIFLVEAAAAYLPGCRSALCCSTVRSELVRGVVNEVCCRLQTTSARGGGVGVFTSSPLSCEAFASFSFSNFETCSRYAPSPTHSSAAPPSDCSGLAGPLLLRRRGGS